MGEDSSSPTQEPELKPTSEAKANEAPGHPDQPTEEVVAERYVPYQVAAQITSDIWHPELTPVIRYHFIYSLGGLVVGLGCVVSGVVLFLHGVTGSSSWIGSFIGAQSKLSDAAPGTVLFIVGLFIVWATRFDVKIGNRASSQRRRQSGRPRQ